MSTITGHPATGQEAVHLGRPRIITSPRAPRRAHRSAGAGSLQPAGLTFYLGAHHPNWLETSPVPLFVSRTTIERYRSRGDATPKAQARWALDSGGFTQLDQHGEWTLDADTYGGMVYRFMDDWGREPDWCAPQDWMCEPWILAKTGATVALHQEWTTENVVYLREQFPAARWIPVVQGWHLDDYLDHVEQYRAAGIDLRHEPVVGLGSVCRRQSTADIGVIAGTLARLSLRLHGFGVKAEGLDRYGHHLVSADSMAWSRATRWAGTRLPGCDHRGDCRNCLAYALCWRERVLATSSYSPSSVQ